MNPRPLEESTTASQQLRILLISESADRTLFELANSDLVQTTSDEAIKLLRQQAFDVAVAVEADSAYLGLLRAAAPQSLAIIAAGPEPTDTAAMRFSKTLADDYLCLTAATAERVKWILLRAAERRQLFIDALQLRTSRAQTHEEERHAAIHQVRALRAAMLEDPEATQTRPPEWLVAKLHELLKVHVVSVSADLHGTTEAFAEGLLLSGVTIHETLMAHSFATERILLGLGNRPGWHALGRSQILAHQLTMFFLRSSKLKSDSPSTSWCETTPA